MKSELGALAAFRSFPEAALDDLAKLATAQDLAEGDVLFRAGDVGDAIFVVIHGEIEIRKGERTLARLHPGQTVGEMALLEVQRRSADAYATGPSRVLRLERESFASFLQEHPECGARFYYETGREMSRRLRRTSEYLMTVFEVGRIVGAGRAVDALAAAILERLLGDVEEAACGRLLLRHPLAAEVEIVSRAGATDLPDAAVLDLAAQHAAEPGWHAVAESRAILGAMLAGEAGDAMGAIVLEKQGDETPFTVDQEIVLEAVAHQAEQGIHAAWARAEQADRERLERHRQQGY